LIKPSYRIKDGIHVVNFDVMYLEKWWSVGVNKVGYLVDSGVEDFIISNWELLAPKQPQGPSIGEKNMNTRGTNVSIRNEEMALPKFVVFNSLLNKNYLRPVLENSYIKFDAVDVISWGVKHEIQKAKSGGGLLHIRCCDTGKYWSWGLTEYSKSYIVAQANQSGEDITTRACTLIKPSHYTKDGVTVVNLQVMYKETWWSIGGDGEGYLVVGGEDFVISDWESLPFKQPQGPSVSDINMNTGGDASIRNEKINANPVGMHPLHSDAFQVFPPLLYSLLPLLVIFFFVFQKIRKERGNRLPNIENELDSRGNGRDEDFIRSDLDLLLPKQPNGPSDGDKNPNNGVGSSIRNTTMGGGFSMEKSNVGGNVWTGATIINMCPPSTQRIPDLEEQLREQLSAVVQ